MPAADTVRPVGGDLAIGARLPNRVSVSTAAAALPGIVWVVCKGVEGTQQHLFCGLVVGEVFVDP